LAVTSSGWIHDQSLLPVDDSFPWQQYPVWDDDIKVVHSYQIDHKNE